LLAYSLPAGAFDPSFNSIGAAYAQVGAFDRVSASALQPDGKIVVAASATADNGSQTIALVRFTPRGQPDPSFGGQTQPGVAELASGSMINEVHAVAVDGNQGSPYQGDIVVAGSWTSSTQQVELALARFKPDGSLDTSFGTGGFVVDATEPNATGLSLVIQPDDKIAVLGASNWPSKSAIAFVERFAADGTADSSFDGGKAVFPFGNVAVALTGGLALDADGDMLLAGVENAGSSSPAIAVAQVEPDGARNHTGIFGFAITSTQSHEVPLSVDGVATDSAGGILVAGTAEQFNPRSPGTSTPNAFWVARYDGYGRVDTSFNFGKLEFIYFRQSAVVRPQPSGCRGIALTSDGKIVLAGETLGEDSNPDSTVREEDIALARLNSDGTLDESFGEGGLVIDSNGPASNGSAIDELVSSFDVQPDGNIVTAFTWQYSNESDFAVNRYLGHARSAGSPSGTIPAGVYQETFVTASSPNTPTLYSSDVFQHWLWEGLHLTVAPFGVAMGHGWDLERHPAGGSFALHEKETYPASAALDAITFPNLRPDVRVALASVEVAAVDTALVTFVGTNGSYTVKVARGTTQTAAAGESHVLTGSLLNPSIELGPIREIVLDSQNAYFSNLKILAIPGNGPLDEFVTAAPGKSTSIDVLGYAEAGASAAGLQLPLQIVGQPGSPSLPGATTAPSASDPGQIVYTNTVTAQPGQHPADSFTYTVQDATGEQVTATVYVTIDAPPSFVSVTPKFEAVVNSGHWVIPHGLPGPLNGYVDLADAERDPVMLTINSQATTGVVTLKKLSQYKYSFSYQPPTIESYNQMTGVTTPVSAIVGPDQFVLEASDGLATTEYPVELDVPDGYDLQLMSWGDGSTVPTLSRYLVIAGTDSNGLLHIRTFDSAGVRTDTYEAMEGTTLHLVSADASGKVLSDSPESSLSKAQAQAIAGLKQGLPGLLPPHVLTQAADMQVLGEATLITGHILPNAPITQAKTLVTGFPDTPGPTDFIVPENTGVSYYTPGDTPAPYFLNYDASLDHPGLVHFAAPGVLYSVVDSYGDPLIAAADPYDPPKHGSVQIFRDGSFNYTPIPDYTGPDDFGFIASDGYESTRFGVKILVAKNAPVLRDHYYRLHLGDSAVTLTVNPPGYGITNRDLIVPSQHDWLYPYNVIQIRPSIRTNESGTNRDVLEFRDVDIARTNTHDLAYAYSPPLNGRPQRLELYWALFSISLVARILDASDINLTKPFDLRFTAAIFTTPLSPSPDRYVSNFEAVNLLVFPWVSAAHRKPGGRRHQTAHRATAARQFPGRTPIHLPLATGRVPRLDRPWFIDNRSGNFGPQRR
jgi:uncharacterized delta-60 repeat protein